MKPTYRIDTLGGVAARWLPSIDAAKSQIINELYLPEPGEETPVIAFEPSTEDEDGHPVPEYIRVTADGRWEASICQERPAWPTNEFPYGNNPDLVMVTESSCSCKHPRLVCRSLPARDSEFAVVPIIWCSGCGCSWLPEAPDR